MRNILIAILTLEARLVLWKYKPKIIAVTGSVGKTTTKDAVFAVVAAKEHARKAIKGYNSEFGVPLTVLGCDSGWNDPLKWIANIFEGLRILVTKHPYPHWLIVEVGADRPGDIARVARWLRPDIAVITSVPDVPVHIEFFGSPDAVLKEKKSLAEYVKPGGKVILNGDDVRVRSIKSEYRSLSLTYGFGENDYTASHMEIEYEEKKPAGIHFRVQKDGSSVPVVIHGALGLPRVYAALAALAVGDILGIDLGTGAQALATLEPTPGRLRILEGVHGSVIIDDSYNSSPVAALAALDLLQSIKTKGKKTVVLGDMLELGKHSADAHREVGTRAADCANKVITVGFRARAIGEAALDAGTSEKNVREYELGESERAGKELRAELKKDDIVLVKGSQSMRMEQTVRELMAEPIHAPELLVRQEEEWLKR